MANPGSGPSGSGPPGPTPPADADGGRFTTRLPAFAGPLDLLLYLIHKNEIDIFDIPITRILDQYLAHVSKLQQAGILNLNDAGEFLVLATRLMEIKSRLLLPTPSDVLDGDDELEEELEDPRKGLVEQLLAYKEIKERAMLLEEVHRQRSLQFDRISTEEIPEPEAVLELGEVSIWDMCSAFQRVVEEQRTREDVKVIELDEIAVEDVIRSLKNRLQAIGDRPVRFRDLFPRKASTSLLIAHFLAILEMARLQLLIFEQDGQLGDILVHRRNSS